MGKKKAQDNKEVRSSCDQQETTTLTIEVVSWECNSGIESRAQGHHTQLSPWLQTGNGVHSDEQAINHIWHLNFSRVFINLNRLCFSRQ